MQFLPFPQYFLWLLFKFLRKLMVKNNENHHHLLQRRWRHLLRYISLFNITPIRLRHGSSGRGGGGGIIPGLPGGGGMLPGLPGGGGGGLFPPQNSSAITLSVPFFTV